jgi:hypothetical protein
MGGVVTETGCGWLVDPTSPAEVALAIERAFTDPGELRTRGEAGRRAVLDRYNWNEAEAILLGVYRKLNQ